MTLDPHLVTVAELLGVKGMLDKKGLADFLGLSESWVSKAVSARKIPFTTCGTRGEIRFAPHHVAAIVLMGEQPVEVPLPAADPGASDADSLLSRSRRSRRRAA